jgi:DNA-directed RNA polymerase specialized sigma24 family protein
MARPTTDCRGTNPKGFERLLDLLDDDPARQAARFEILRQRLIRLLMWRGCRDPEALTDETIDRVAIKLAAGVVIESDDTFRFCAGFARRIALEDMQRARRTQSMLAALKHHPEPEPLSGREEARLANLEACLDAISPVGREQILTFYQGEKGTRIAGRKRLAESLGITVNALRIRAHRLRARLEECVRQRLRTRENRQTSRHVESLEE